MRAIQRLASYVDIVEARDPANPALVVKLGVGSASFQQNVQNALFSTVAQYYGIVQDDMLKAIHCFRGLQRPLMQEDEKEGDKNALVYSWRPEVDYVWAGSKVNGKSVPKIPPPNRVFVVLVRENSAPENFPEHGVIYGSIEKWNWVKEDPVLQQAPIGWERRYAVKLWSRA
jgi:hypothetical protein